MIGILIIIFPYFLILYIMYLYYIASIYYLMKLFFVEIIRKRVMT